MTDVVLTPAADQERLIRLATYASVATATVLIVAKLAAWIATGSISVLASLVDSLLDAGASVTNMLAVRYALKPPDADHRFGHGKAESLSGLAQAMFVAGSALFLVLESVSRINTPRPVEHIGVGLGVFGFATLITLMLVLFQRYVIKRTRSTAIRADALHYATDLLTATGVIIALMLSWTFDLNQADAWFALAIAVFILYSAWQIGRDALHVLMDREMPEAQRQQIVDLVLRHPAVLGIHDLRTRQSGAMVIVQFHLDLDGQQSLFAAHAVADEVEMRIREVFPNADITIHQDPIKVGEEPAGIR